MPDTCAGSNPENRIERILVIRGGGLGDFLLILPVLAALQDHWPRAEVQLLCNPEMGKLAAHRGYTLSVHSIHDSNVAALFSGHTLDKLPDYLHDIDLVISFLRDPSGQLEKNLRKSVSQVLLVPPPEENGTHAATQFLRNLEAIGILSEEAVPHLGPSPRARAVAIETLPSLFQDPAASPIAIHPGSGSTSKNWSTRGFAEIILRAEDQLGCSALVVTGEADTEPRRRLRQELGGVFPFELHLNPLDVLASVLQCCSILVGNDSGVSHLAAALGIPVLAIFGPTLPGVWRPLGSNVRILDFKEASPNRVQEEIRQLLQLRRAVSPPRADDFSV